jgi:hypothetical protein
MTAGILVSDIIIARHENQSNILEFLRHLQLIVCGVGKDPVFVSTPDPYLVGTPHADPNIIITCKL